MLATVYEGDMKLTRLIRVPYNTDIALLLREQSHQAKLNRISVLKFIHEYVLTVDTIIPFIQKLDSVHQQIVKVE
jgi:hypothetical protein